MQRVCFVLQVRPARLEEYKQRHRSVWPEMQAALRETGWGMDFSSAIWRRKTLNGHEPEWPSGKSTNPGSGRCVAFSFSPTARCPTAPCSR
jgi:hypothetical protein